MDRQHSKYPILSLHDRWRMRVAGLGPSPRGSGPRRSAIHEGWTPKVSKGMIGIPPSSPGLPGGEQQPV